MKFSLLLLLFLTAGASGRADTMGDVADIAIPKGWIKGNPGEPGAPPDPFPTFEYHPTDGRNEKVLLTLFLAETVRVSDRVSLKAFLMVASRPMLPSPGFIPAIRNLEIAGAIGAYASFEDPSLVGKPPQKGNYKFASPVIVLLPNGYVVQSTVFTDSASGADFDEALGLIRSLTPLEPRAHAAAPSVVSVPGLDSTLQLPAGRFTPKPNGLNTSANYFSFADSQGIILSGWLDHASEFPGMAPFWAKEKAAQLKGGFAIKSEMAMKIGGWDAILYVVPMGAGIEQKNIRACRVVGATWADLHLSRTAQASTFRELEDVVRALDFALSGSGRAPVTQ